jgi:glycosyltransferase involved in cell wall biosynthesis
VISKQVAHTSERRVKPADYGLLELSVVIPVFNQAETIAGNIEIIRTCLQETLGDTFELIVVSDGSIDETAERVLAARADNVRTIHYARNLGKGYAVKVGALAGQGRWIAFIDSDLDLQPSRLPEFLRVAKAEELDFAIGSKRHPESEVSYPLSRRRASWLYQQLVRALFRLDVRDTQVGMKLFRREIADQVIPLLVVKRYAFDLELLAVSRAFGFRRIRELPITLEYQFTGSGVRSLAVAHALLDTVAVFYRLRILRYYQRKQRLLEHDLIRPGHSAQSVTIVTTDPEAVAGLDWPEADVARVDVLDAEHVRAAALAAHSDVLALVGEGVSPAANWLSATVPYLSSATIDAAVVPKVAPTGGTLLERAAAAVCESRLGGGARYFRYAPGNLRLVDDYPDDTIVVGRDRFLELGDVPLDEVCSRLTAAGSSVVYTPDTIVADRPEPLFMPRFREAARYGTRRGRHVRARKGTHLRVTTLAPVALLLFLAVTPAAVLAGGPGLRLWLAVAIAYAAVLLAGGALAALRFGSLAIGALTVVGVLGTHLAFGGGFVQGLRSAGNA